MSRLTDLLAKAKAKDPVLGAELDREFKILSSRLPFGLNFERHSPEAVELPLRPVRKGDKVRILPERGAIKKGDQRLWQVKSINKAKMVAVLELTGAAENDTQTVMLEDLVVVAESRDIIYPGLVSTGKVLRGGEKPFHTVINGENYHALKALTYTHRGCVDAIYIDPPYNTGAKDWKYNNDYVEADDLYRHSKWLAMMERRLLIAHQLLNPADSVLIVTIDEKEYLRLGLLLEQIFPEARIQMVSITTNPKGASRPDMFARVDEFAYFVLIGNSSVSGITVNDSQGQPVRWPYLRRSDEQSTRGHRPRQFYPVFVDPKTSKIVGVGEPLAHDVSRESIKPPPGVVAVFPVRDDGVEMEWGLTGPSLMRAVRGGFARANRTNSLQPYAISYLTAPAISKVESGEYIVSGLREDGTKIVIAPSGKTTRPTTVWAESRHSAPDHGKKVLGALIPARTFPFPKSLYAVEDSLRLFVANKKDAIVLDFFSGSGTTAHAVMRLNKQDGGSRQCICITNNEVSADEQKILLAKKLRPGDVEWEKFGICDYITKPRVAAAITGKTPEGNKVVGDYKFIDEFPMSEGFEENAEFFTLTYETPISISYNLAFHRIAPLLWLRAGARGSRIENLPDEGWAVADTYGLLTNVDAVTPFIKALGKELNIAYIVTNDDRRFQAIAKRLPDGIEAVRLYESYLNNFSFSNGE
ncbi:TPA: site-specific DNA-methyltransferase [Citrobacter freundii]|uniref:Site-specific DNA-methyltransferase n=1 Tax=Citrobacter portucalensis TaxID=1639133 RepID=A0A9X4GI36_9ENTR|nr:MULTISPECIES: DNA methyltransferase [Citrobacter freundii complex]EMB4321479.1 site-specific DNA-methyltransferase [Citrobacter freundii]KAA1148853.1 site-specific DNA-methyltransferase [Citrobacter portucalensis]MBJ9193739.1 site-specific DNA-methyltransferase [Citrobacter freundii]MDE9619677.1 site-specific DNA-methyltransferase [Citrobacter portucalensis]MDS0975566.1 DNA methyltransferase [Citrobacter portucalensis]